MRTDTKTLAAAMRALAAEVQSEDGVANAAIAEAAQRLDELTAEVGAPTNPRHLLWRVWHGDNPGMRLYDYTAWINQRWAQFCEEHRRNRHMLTAQDHADFDDWLRHWARREIARTVSEASAF